MVEKRSFVAVACVLGLLVYGGPAGAVKPPLPLARGGAWAASRDSYVSPPNGCDVSGWLPGGATFGMASVSGDANGPKLELIIGYSYPALHDLADKSILKTLTIAVDATPRSIPVSSRDDFTLFASLNRVEMGALLDNMEHGATLTVTTDATAPVVLPLAGAGPALEAFRTCVGLSSKPSIVTQQPKSVPVGKVPPLK